MIIYGLVLMCLNALVFGSALRHYDTALAAGNLVGAAFCVAILVRS